MTKETAMEMVKGSTRELVWMDGQSVVTDSRIVAEYFEKTHKHVLEAIKNLEIPQDWRESNFRLSHYEVKTPTGGVKTLPLYLMTRKGFTILAMGFTGKKATMFRLAYIEEFEQKESNLTKLKESLMIDNAINIATRALSAAHESQTKALIGTVREQEALIESKDGIIKSQRKAISVLSEKSEMVHEVGELDDKGRIKAGVRRSTSFVLPNMQKTSQSIQAMAHKLNNVETYIDYDEDNEPVQLRFEFNTRGAAQ